MKVQVHRAEPRHTVHNVEALKRFVPKEALLFAVEHVMLLDVVVRCQKKPPSAAGGVADGGIRLGAHYLDDCSDEGPRGEVLTGPAFDIGSVSLKQALVNVTLYVSVHLKPSLFVHHGWV